MGTMGALFYAPAIEAGPMRLILYQRDDCKLCDEALAIIAGARVPDFESVWIDGDAELERRYGDRVPVLCDAGDGRELGWPFGVDEVRRFVDAG
jgi:hypothetical protein